MESVKARQAIPFFRSNKSFSMVVILVILGVIGLGIYFIFRPVQAQPLPQVGTIVSQQTLAEQYGLGVNLIAVTAGGGMLDLRLKIIDSEKAKALLEDHANFPALRVGKGVVLRSSDDMATQVIKFENGSSIFALFANSQNIVKPGDPVTIVFGDLQVEPISAK